MKTNTESSYIFLSICHTNVSPYIFSVPDFIDNPKHNRSSPDNSLSVFWYKSQGPVEMIIKLDIIILTNCWQSDSGVYMSEWMRTAAEIQMLSSELWTYPIIKAVCGDLRGSDEHKVKHTHTVCLRLALVRLWRFIQYVQATLLGTVGQEIAT